MLTGPGLGSCPPISTSSKRQLFVGSEEARPGVCAFARCHHFGLPRWTFCPCQRPPPLRWTSACYLLSGVLGLSLLQVDFILCTTVGRPDCPTRGYEPPEPVTSFVGAGWTPEDLLSISLEARFCKLGASCFAVHWRAIDVEAQSGQLEVCWSKVQALPFPSAFQEDHWFWFNPWIRGWRSFGIWTWPALLQQSHVWLRRWICSSCFVCLFPLVRLLPPYANLLTAFCPSWTSAIPQITAIPDPQSLDLFVDLV